MTDQAIDLTRLTTDCMYCGQPVHGTRIDERGYVHFKHRQDTDCDLCASTIHMDDFEDWAVTTEEGNP